MTSELTASTPRSLDPDEFRWVSYAIPGSSPPVQLARLDAEPSGGFTVLVRFPAGWERPATGFYEAAEEVLFLVGEFEMSGIPYAAGDAGWFPAHYRRAGTRSGAGALALAWFSGPDRWTEGVAADAAEAEAGTVGHRWTGLALEPTPLGVAGRALHGGEGRSTWLVDALDGGIVVPGDVVAIDVFDLATHRFLHATSGQLIPAVPIGPAWVRQIITSG